MLEWDRPKTRKQVQHFCGIINFFRRFIPNASELLLPIQSIVTTQPKSFDWNLEPKWEECYQTIYQELVTKVPFLQFPLEGIPLELETDASASA
ncbi:hypothetical protein AKO1_004883, partial [Acrasis kona]